MKNETKIEVIAALEEYMHRYNLSANEVAKKSGVNPSYISTMRSGNFTMHVGDNDVDIADKYFEMVASLIDFKLEKTYWETVPTTQMKQIINSLESAKVYGSTIVIIGETGSGKTYVSNLFVRNYPVDAWIITIGSQDNLSDIIEKMCDKIGVSIEKTKSRTIRSLIKKLKTMRMDGHRPIIIFDEAEYMKQPAMCNMKELYDHLFGICAIVLMGTEQLTRHMDKMLKKNKDGIPQLWRRIKFGVRSLQAIDRTFKMFLNAILNGREIDNSVIRFLIENCNNYGELHDVLVPAMREADRTGQPLTENLIRTMLNMPKL